jgi:hypothetical protein
MSLYIYKIVPEDIAECMWKPIRELPIEFCRIVAVDYVAAIAVLEALGYEGHPQYSALGVRFSINSNDGVDLAWNHTSLLENPSDPYPSLGYPVLVTVRELLLTRLAIIEAGAYSPCALDMFDLLGFKSRDGRQEGTELSQAEDGPPPPSDEEIQHAVECWEKQNRQEMN